jgi:hypothetical protein
MDSGQDQMVSGSNLLGGKVFFGPFSDIWCSGKSQEGGGGVKTTIHSLKALQIRKGQRFKSAC